MTTWENCNQTAVIELLKRYGLRTSTIETKQPIPGSFWGDAEAGLIGNTLYLRDDTPLHSALHEACHYICMSPQRRVDLHTDAGGSNIEESAVCYLQCLLADELPNFGLHKSFQDMDEWGYSFRLGSTQAWFEQDAEDALAWLLNEQLIAAPQHKPTYQLRLTPDS